MYAHYPLLNINEAFFTLIKDGFDYKLCVHSKMRICKKLRFQSS